MKSQKQLEQPLSVYLQTGKMQRELLLFPEETAKAIERLQAITIPQLCRLVLLGSTSANPKIANAVLQSLTVVRGQEGIWEAGELLKNFIMGAPALYPAVVGLIEKVATNSTGFQILLCSLRSSAREDIWFAIRKVIPRIKQDEVEMESVWEWLYYTLAQNRSFGTIELEGLLPHIPNVLQSRAFVSTIAYLRAPDIIALTKWINSNPSCFLSLWHERKEIVHNVARSVIHYPNYYGLDCSPVVTFLTSQSAFTYSDERRVQWLQALALLTHDWDYYREALRQAGQGEDKDKVIEIAEWLCCTWGKKVAFSLIEAALPPDLQHMLYREFKWR